MPRNNKNTSPAIIPKPTLALTNTNTRPTLGQTMKEGFSFGVGASVAQHAVNGVMNFLSPPRSSSIVETTKQIEYEKCMKYSFNDSDLCKTLLDN